MRQCDDVSSLSFSAARWRGRSRRGRSSPARAAKAACRHSQLRRGPGSSLTSSVPAWRTRPHRGTGSLDHLSLGRRTIGPPPGAAAELVASNVDVIIALGPASWAAIRATGTIPIVMAFSGDPVGNGIVRTWHGRVETSPASPTCRPSRGQAPRNAEPVVQKNARLAILYNPGEPATELEMRETEAAARTIGVASSH